MSTPTQTAAAPFTVAAATTPAKTVEAAARTVHKRSFTEQIEYLLTSVGPKITAAGAGLSDARQLPAWRQGGTPPREEVKLARVAALAEVTAAVMAEYPASVAASFLRSSQPALDDQAPVVMIREASQEDLPEIMGAVRQALRAFLAG